MSPQQAWLWGLQGGAAAGTYHAQCVAHISGPVDRARFDAALAATVARHELLRTALLRLTAMTVPLQVIGAEGRVALEFHDLTAAGADALHALVTAQRARSCAVDEGAVVLLALARLDADQHALIIDCPSLWADTQGLRNLLGELAHAYAGDTAAEEPLQYADLAEWQCELLDAPSSEVGRDYWRRQNLDEARRAALPRSPTVNLDTPFAPQSHTQATSLSLAALTSYAARNAVAPRAVLLAAWQVYLQRLCAVQELVIGYCCDGRSYDELKNALGVVARSVPAWGSYDGALAFSTLVRRVDATVIALERWQECYASLPVSDDEHAQPRSFAFSFEYRAASAPLECAGLRWSLSKEYCCLDRAELKLLVAEGASDTLHCEWHFDAARVDAQRVAWIADGFLVLLHDALARDSAPLASLAMIGDVERTIIDTALCGEVDARAAACVHDLIAAHARSTPHAIAVVDEQCQLSYGGLVTRATELAVRLAQAGVGPEARVALCVERGVDLIVGMLGILLAGGAYVPIDPQLPAARQRYIADDSAAAVVVGMAALAGSPLCAERQLIALDDGPAVSGMLPSIALSPANAAYVLYTSGSTGAAKGVVIEHRQLCNYIRGLLARLELSSPTSFALLSTFGADLGNTAVFGALASGGTLHLPSAACAADPEALAEFFDGHPVDGLKIVPSHLQALLASPAAARILPRRYLVLGGEALRWSLLDAVAALAPNCAVFNHYGPTETTVGCVCGRVDAESARGNSVALGRPLSNVSLAIVDAQGATLPLGVAGELLIGGASVARGYLNRPALDTERFTSDGERHYRSGDLVRLREDGQLEFVTRADDQLKVRGFRVEPGEVAATLARHAEVRDCVVLAQRHDDDARLIAYLVPATLDTSALRCWLAEQVPEYMLPSQFVTLDALPLNPNGKADRQALAALSERASHGRNVPLVALDGTQAIIAGIWCEQLHLDGVRADDKFFDLGGNSLGALQVVGRLKKATGVRVTPRDLLLQTLTQLATLIDSRNAGKRDERATG